MSGKSTNAKTEPTEATAKPFVIRGTIRTIDLLRKSFTLEPISPYVFEKTGDDGSSEKYALFIRDNDNSQMEARLVKRDQTFKLKGGGALNIAVIVSLKTAREEIEVGVSANSLDADDNSLAVSTIRIV